MSWKETLATTAAWGFAGVLGIVSLLGPMFYDEICHTKAWEDHSVKHVYHKASAKSYILGIGYAGGNVPCIGMFFWPIVLGSFLLAYLLKVQRRFDRADGVHRWTWRFLTAMLVQCILAVVRPWIFAACPLKPWDVSVWWGLAILCSTFAFLVAQACLLQIAVLRLSLVADPVVARRARRMMMAVLFCGGGSCMLIALSEAAIAPKFAAGVAIAATLLLYVCFQLHATVVFGLSAHAAVKESRAQDSGHEGDALLALATAVMLGLAAGTTVYFLAAEALRDDTALMRWIFELSIPVNQCSDVGLALLCAGLFGTWQRCPERKLSEIGDLVQDRRERQIRKRLLEAAKASTGPAVMLAALIESQDADQLMFEAIQRFRCISWDVLAQRPDIIIGGGPLNVVGVAGSDLYNLSKPCQISDCDAFVSHSWHDHGFLKWVELKAWCEQFEREEHRWPQLWLDRVCINQQNIDDDLKCLPIFLAGCERLLVLAGSTYTSRLWCCLELFVYMQMIVDDPTREPPIIETLGADKSEMMQVQSAWLVFDAAGCSCFKPEDKQRMLKIFDRYPGGLAEFNQQIQLMAPTMQANVNHIGIVCV